MMEYFYILNHEIWISVAIILFVSSMLQSILGFGFSLVALPLLILIDLTFVDAVCVCIGGSVIQKTASVIHLRSFIDWRTLYPMIAVGLLSFPLGLFLMYRTSLLDQSVVRQVVGYCILVLVGIQWFGSKTRTNRVAPQYGYLAAFFSGVLNGFANIGGPPLVFWVLAHHWPKEKMRVMAIAFSLLFFPFQLVVIPAIYGPQELVIILECVIFLPFILVGVRLGSLISKKINEKKLRIAIRCVLIAVAFHAIAFHLTNV